MLTKFNCITLFHLAQFMIIILQYLFPVFHFWASQIKSRYERVSVNIKLQKSIQIRIKHVLCVNE